MHNHDSVPSPSARWRVLIFPGATEIALELREALGWCKEVELFSAAADVSNHGPFAFARHFVVPAVNQSGWLAALQALVLEHGITHIFPAHDDALLALAENADGLRARVLTSPLETCRLTRSKRATLQHLAGVVPTPRLFANIAEVSTFPVFVKPDRGQGSRGTALVTSRDSLRALLAGNPELIVVEHLAGEEFTVDCLTDRERGLLFAAGRTRRRIRSGIAMDSAPVNEPIFEDYARRIGGVMDFHGAWFFQVKRDREGVFKLLEVAPRIGGTSALTRARGVNLPLLSLYEADRLPFRIAAADHVVAIDRALRNRYRHTLQYQTLYVDFDDTLVVHGRLHLDLVKLLHQSIAAHVRVVLLTRHGGEIDAMLRRFRIAPLFDEIVHLRHGEPKSDYIHDRSAVFIDDSFAERMAVQRQTGVPAFAPSMIEMLLDDRI